MFFLTAFLALDDADKTMIKIIKIIKPTTPNATNIQVSKTKLFSIKTLQVLVISSPSIIDVALIVHSPTFNTLNVTYSSGREVSLSALTISGLETVQVMGALIELKALKVKVVSFVISITIFVLEILKGVSWILSLLGEATLFSLPQTTSTQPGKSINGFLLC